jgi:hypothetical protein
MAANHRPRRGEANEQHRLTDRAVLRMRRLYVPGSREYGTVAFARHYRVSTATVWKAVRGAKWSHLPGARRDYRRR